MVLPVSLLWLLLQLFVRGRRDQREEKSLLTVHKLLAVITLHFVFSSLVKVMAEKDEKQNIENTDSESYKESESSTKNVAEILATDNEDESLRKVLMT